MLPPKNTKAVEETEAAEVGKIEAILSTLQIDPHFAVGDCRDAMLNVLRQAADWSKFPEAKQRDINTAIGNAARDIVVQLVEAISGEGRETLPVSIEAINIKDGLKITLKAPLDVEHIGQLAEAKTGLLCLVRTEAFDHARSSPPVDADQPSLIDGSDDLVNAADPVLGHGDVFDHPEHGECEVRIDLPQGMINLVKPDGDGDEIEFREATSDELKQERERIADFTPTPEPVEA